MAGQKLKSIHITNYYHKNSGGISTAYDRLLEAANRQHRFVRLIVPGETSVVEDIGEYGRIYYVRAIKAPIFDKRYRLMLPFQYIFNSSPIRKILESELPDIIEIGEKYMLSYLAGMIRIGYYRALNRPMLVHFSCERMDDNIRAFISRARPFRWFARRVMANYIAPMFDFHLANSNYTAQEMRDALSKEKNPHRSDVFFNFCHRLFRRSEISFDQRIFVNQCGADTDLFNASRKDPIKRKMILAEAGFPENAIVLLYAGRLSPEKNVALLPKVLRSLLQSDHLKAEGDQYRLLVAGDGPLKNWLEDELLKAAPKKYKMLGHITDRRRLADIYANSDIFIHPNPREPFGISPLEAMSSGLPVVAPNSGGVLSYSNHENAWLEDPRPDCYSAAVLDIVNNHEKRERKVLRALETAQNYGWETSTDRLFALYDEMYEDFCGRNKMYVCDPKQQTNGFKGRQILRKEE